MRVMASGVRGAQRARGQLQGRRGRVRADVLRLEPRRVTAGIRAGLPRVRARVRLFKKRLGKMFVPPGAGLWVHDGVEKSLQIRVKVFGDMDHLLAR